MGKMTTHAQIQAQYFIAGLQNSQANSCIGLGTTMRLNIGVFAVKYLFQPVNGELFRLVHNFTTTIIPPAGISLCVFVGHYIAHGLHDLNRGKIFRCDQFNPMSLAFKFLVNEVKNELVSLHGANLGQL